VKKEAVPESTAKFGEESKRGEDENQLVRFSRGKMADLSSDLIDLDQSGEIFTLMRRKFAQTLPHDQVLPGWRRCRG
jgi:hypothetical protein